MAAYMGEGDNSSRDDSSAPSPPFLDEMSYLSLRQRILNNRTTLSEQSPNSFESYQAPRKSESHTDLSSAKNCQGSLGDQPSSSTLLKSNEQQGSDEGNITSKNQQKVLNSSQSIDTLSSKNRLVVSEVSYHRSEEQTFLSPSSCGFFGDIASTDHKVLKDSTFRADGLGAVISDPSPSALTAESIITSWSVDAISPKNQQSCDDRHDHSSDRQTGTSCTMTLLLDDEGSKDFEIDLNSQSSYDYDANIMQDRRCPTIVEVDNNIQVKIPSPCIPHEEKLWELPPPSPHPPSSTSWSYPMKKVHTAQHVTLSKETRKIHSTKISALDIPTTEKNRISSGHNIKTGVIVQNHGRKKNENVIEANVELPLDTPMTKKNKFPSFYPMDFAEKGQSFLRSFQDVTDAEPFLHYSTSKKVDTCFFLASTCPKATVSHLRSLLSCQGFVAACKKDPQGRYPLHTLSSNHGLIVPLLEKHFSQPHHPDRENLKLDADRMMSMLDTRSSAMTELEQLILDLISLNPKSLVSLDCNGRIPFTEYLHQWIQLSNDQINEQGDLSVNSLHNPAFFYDNCRSNSTDIQSDTRTDVEHGLSSSLLGMKESSSSCFNTIYVEWCFKMLNRIYSFISELNLNFDEDEDLQNLLSPYACNVDGFKKKFVSIISSIPSLMKILILKSDILANKHVLSCFPIFQLIMKADESVGDWIVYMIEAFDHDVVTRTVQYLECFSDIVGNHKACKQNGSTETDNILRLFHKFSNLNFLLPATLSIEQERDAQRAVSTKIVQFSMDHELRKHSSVIIVLLDFSFRALLIIFYHLLSSKYVLNQTDQTTYQISFYLVLTSALYGLIRLLSRMISTLKLSLTTYNNTVGGFYDWTERMSLVMALVSTIWIDVVKNDPVSDTLRYIISLSLLFLWTRLLSWFFVVNHTATLFFRAVGKVHPP
jgi:hypothetical protein